MSDLFNEMMEEISERDIVIEQLKQQLVEKDEQMRTRIDVYEKQFIEMSDELYQLRLRLVEKNNLLKQAQNLAVMRDNEQIEQDKISFCIEKLEELADCSNYINSQLDFECGFYVSEKCIREQIKQLKEMK